MQKYSNECLRCFLDNQLQLFDEKVAETPQEAEAFLEDSMAVVLDSLDQVREYFEQSGMDASDMGDSELEEAAEVFQLPGGQYLVVEA